MSETRLVRRDELLQGDKGGGFRGRQPNACFLDAAICAGLRPADVLVYVKRSQGRENRPYKKRSTVDAKSDAFCKSYSAPKRQTKSLRYHCTTVAHSSNPLPNFPVSVRLRGTCRRRGSARRSLSRLRMEAQVSVHTRLRSRSRNNRTEAPLQPSSRHRLLPGRPESR